jgi:cytochrome c biogenesis protein CcmG/thiol:disulfide interchange protein DsbE
MYRALLIALQLGWFAVHDGASAAPALDRPAPTLVATQLDGATFDLSKLRGKVVLVTYWASWCAPCKKEMPLLNGFFQRHRDDGLEIIGISVDRPKDFDKMRRMSRSLAYPTTTTERVSDDGFGAPEGFPLTYVIDRDGIVRDKFIDVRDQLLRDVVLPLLRH